MTRSKKLRCFGPAETVDITRGETGIEAEEPTTIPQFYNKIFRKKPNNRALRWKGKGDHWQSITYIEYKKLIYNVSKSFLKVIYFIWYTSFTCMCNSGCSLVWNLTMLLEFWASILWNGLHLV